MSIVIRNLCKRFGDTPVLQDFTWTVDGPAVLMGRSGCGKTTLLRILMGLEAPELALPATRLSGGQKRRTALLRALLCRDAQTLLLDEPFTGMDAELVADAVNATKRLAGARPTILVTHDRAAAELLGWPVKEV